MNTNATIINKQHFPSPNPLVRLFLVTYMSEGLKVKGLLAEPKEKGIYEGFLYLRGGIKNVGMVRPARIAQFASEGFVVFAPFYRGNRGGEGNEDFAGEDRNDAFSAFHLLKNLPNVQENRVHVFGFSRGGVMALFTAIQYPEAASIVTWGGVSDLALTYMERKDMRRMMKRVIGGSPKTKTAEYESRTPLYELEKLKPPVLIIHGELDHNVSVEHAKRLEQRLQSLKKHVETWYFKNFTHYFPPSINREVVQDLCLWMKNQKYGI
ncbi:alpha/beta hydrolase family protein [Lederbergia panacisoli]|uniref:alpha/beta hydrolase family protein n=1 Tax=Lederbergia panacisoli TaxID=1255251 RepID=UPI00214D03E9|nr:prolyl oligopeptidase family serine peptidase [Lederbergia panacisoli]MCR2821775.1 prolyl oligopeptidase family serine peptidase [Lederbergia panacisoli]